MAQVHDATLLSVAEAVSDALGAPIEDLPPLSESISLEGLAAIMDHGGSEDVRVSFSFAGLRVVVHTGGLVYVRPIHETGPRPVVQGSCGPFRPPGGFDPGPRRRRRAGRYRSVPVAPYPRYRLAPPAP